MLVRSLLALSTLLLASPSLAAPKTVLLVAGEHEHAALKASLTKGGYEVVDLSHVHAALVHYSPLGGAQVVAEIPEWATGDLKKEWESGAAACRAHEGAGSQKMSFTLLECSKKLGRALWQRDLDRRSGPEVRVVESRVRHSPREGRWTVTVAAYEAGSMEMREQLQSCTDAKKANSLAAKLAAEVLAGEGRSAKRELMRDLPAPPLGEQPASAIVASRYAAVPPPPGCGATLPAALTISPANSHSKTLEARWTDSVAQAGAAGAPRACEFLYSEQERSFVGVALKTGRGVLTCGDERYEGGASDHMRAGLEDKVSRKLIESLYRKWCPGAAPEGP